MTTTGAGVTAPRVVVEMQYAYAAADFVICRSGAMTCAELAAAGRVHPAAAARR
jgi:UDP-N-acetylglucosamine:LPS N-acetylglucosamine transferase